METIVYAARVKDKELLKRSSSGGAFTALSDVFPKVSNYNSLFFQRSLVTKFSFFPKVFNIQVSLCAKLNIHPGTGNRPA